MSQPSYVSNKPDKKISTQEKHRRAVVNARWTYIIIFLSFFSVCAMAVIVTSAMEREKTGFKAIKVSKPISFIDSTYVTPKPKP
jgi:hypothetical protein